MDRPIATAANDELTVSRILRVNHAGEFAAIQIYRAQIALSPRGPVRDFLVETLAHEKEHLRRFREMMPSRKTGPCSALPMWGLVDRLSAP